MRRLPPRRPRRRTACSFGSSRTSRRCSTQTSRTRSRRFRTERPRIRGVEVGQEAAQKIVALRSDDGSAATPPPFVPGSTRATTSRRRPPSRQPVFTTWRLGEPVRLRPRRPVPARPAAGARPAAPTRPRLNEVQEPRLGHQHHPHAPSRPRSARFWNAPIQNYWNEIAQTVALGHGTALPQTARLFALLT